MWGEHDTGEDDEMELLQADAQPPKATEPSKAALNDLALGREDKAGLAFGLLNNL